MHALKVLVSVIGLLLIVQMCGCQPFPIERSYTYILVTSHPTGEPIIGASATSTTRINDDGTSQSSILAATDVNGVTIVPLVRIGRAAFPGSLLITLELEEHTESFELANSAGAEQVGERWRITVLQTDGDTPPAPKMALQENSLPPRLLIEGYLGAVGVCDNATGNVIWAISPEILDYVESEFTVGIVPPMFVDVSATRTIDGPIPLPCPVATDAASDFTVYWSSQFGNEVAALGSYCRSPAGAAESCP